MVKLFCYLFLRYGILLMEMRESKNYESIRVWAAVWIEHGNMSIGCRGFIIHTLHPSDMAKRAAYEMLALDWSGRLWWHGLWL